MSAHTKGPWSVSELDATGGVSEFHIFIEPGVAVIERKIAGHDHADMHDARLISAAPDLLEALRNALSLLEAVWPEAEDSSVYEAARAAIAKATGEQQ